MKDLSYIKRQPEGDEDPEEGEGGGGLPPKTPPPIPPLAGDGK